MFTDQSGLSNQSQRLITSFGIYSIHNNITKVKFHRGVNFKNKNKRDNHSQKNSEIVLALLYKSF